MYIIYDDFYLKHDTGQGHPENLGRLASIIEVLGSFKHGKNLKFESPFEADNEILELVHNPEYIKNIEKLSSQAGFHKIDPDTIVSENTFRSAKLASGGCLKGIDLLFSERDHVFFALVRPPGHHAFSNHGSGFCIFNNISLAAKYAMEKYNMKKIAIIDFDVHHGNGTQSIFYRSSEVFYISIHQYPLYPGSGWHDEKGESQGTGFNMNIPVVPCSGENDYLIAFKEIISPLIINYDPALILLLFISYAHRDDPLASINLTEDSYYKIMSIIMYMSIAGMQDHSGKKRVKTGIILEGGYNHKATALSVLSTITACMETEKLINNNRIRAGLNKLIGLNKLSGISDNDDFPVGGVLAENRDIFEIIKRNAKI
ncbi:MAG: histone deacetylase [Actinobacteria bacterium]|nr:histone deacetylase [Actinomycetota bacterium]